MLIKTAKIIAMTCTHAALRRRDLVELGFKYDNVLMEEAAQILEIETFVPLMLQVIIKLFFTWSCDNDFLCLYLSKIDFPHLVLKF